MANTKRQDILADLETTLNALSVIQQVIVEQTYAIDLDTVGIPAAFLWSESETEFGGSSPVGQETWDWSIALELWAQETDMETLLQAVNNAIYVDGTRGGCAIDTKRTSIDFFDVDATRHLRGMLVRLRVIYQHTYGVM